MLVRSRLRPPFRVVPLNALRMFEERQNLLVTMTKNEGEKSSSSTSQRAKDSQIHIDRIRAMLKATECA